MVLAKSATVAERATDEEPFAARADPERDDVQRCNRSPKRNDVAMSVRPGCVAVCQSSRTSPLSYRSRFIL